MEEPEFEQELEEATQQGELNIIKIEGVIVSGKEDFEKLYNVVATIFQNKDIMEYLTEKKTDKKLGYTG